MLLNAMLPESMSACACNCVVCFVCNVFGFLSGSVQGGGIEGWGDGRGWVLEGRGVECLNGEGWRV